MPTKKQARVESMFPAIAKYVKGYGYVEIGDQESFGFVVRALGYGGLDFEDDTPETLAEAMAVLEGGLTVTDQRFGVSFEHGAGDTRGLRARCSEMSAYTNATRHAAKCAEPA